jgi:hypothetical protein
MLVLIKGLLMLYYLIYVIYVIEGLISANLNMYDDKNIIKAAKIYAQDLHDDTSSTIRADLFI